MKVNFFSSERAMEDALELIALFGSGQPTSARVIHKESVQHDAIGPRKDLGSQDV